MPLTGLSLFCLVLYVYRMKTDEFTNKVDLDEAGLTVHCLLSIL